jgi:hypothetical protein
MSGLDDPEYKKRVRKNIEQYFNPQETQEEKPQIGMELTQISDEDRRKRDRELRKRALERASGR